jgi:uncharacterized membrane protein
MLEEISMAWNRRYSWASSLRSSLWVVPLSALALEFALKRLAEMLGNWMLGQGWYNLHTGYFGVNATEAHAILDRIFALNVTCLVFAFASLLVAIQVAGGQYTPRIIATTLLRNNVISGIIGLFLFTMIWAHRTMLQLGQSNVVPQLQVFLASVFGLCSLIAFVVLIDYCAKFLRPVSLVNQVGEQGIAVIESMYPQPFRDAPDEDPALPAGPPGRVISHEGHSGVVLALNVRQLVALAERAGCIIEFAAQVGDFVGQGEPLFYLHGNCAAMDEGELRDLVAMGSERTMEQDPTFSFRIEVDIALKALSPAINDPTTAVLAIDQLQRLLGLVGRRSLQNHLFRNRSGAPCLILRTPDWQDFVHLSFREIRQCGAGSVQIERRLRAMIENLIRALPSQRCSALEVELELLDRTLEKAHSFPEDIALARIPDPQGLGGGSGRDRRPHHMR